jgi:hypothetical protein
MKLSIQGFNGANRALEDKLLPDDVGVISNNQKPGRGDLRPWMTPLTVATLAVGKKTIYRFGRDTVSDTQYWMSWADRVYAVKGMIGSDTTEKTYYTGDTSGTPGPKVTDSTMAISSAPYPTNSRPLAMPAPSTAPTVSSSANVVSADAGKYKVDLSVSACASIIAGDIFRFTVNGTKTLITILGSGAGQTLPPTPASILLQVQTIAGLSPAIAPASDKFIPNGLRITSTATGVGFLVEKQTSTTNSYADADVTYSNQVGLVLSAAGVLGTIDVPLNSITGASSVSGYDGSARIIFTQSLIDNNPTLFPVNGRITVAVDGGAPQMVTMGAGGGTSPVKVTPQSIADAITGSVTGVQTPVTQSGSYKDPSGATTYTPNVVIATTSTNKAQSTLTIKFATPKVTPVYATVANAAQIVDATKTTVTLYYVYTYVNDWGWESGPSPVSAQLDRPSDSTSTIGGFATPPSGNYNITRVRIYRTQAGASGSANFFQMPSSITAGTANYDIPIATASVTDNNLTLGSTLATADWASDITGLSCLTPLWSGMMAGIIKNAFRFCVAYTPYAWPDAYDATPPDSKPVGIGVFGQTMVGLTTGRPLIISGSSPDSMDQQTAPLLQGCVAPLSIVSMDNGVAWASNDGLCWIGSSGVKLLTAGVMLKEDWQALVPTTITGFHWGGLYIGSYSTDGGTTRKGFIVNPGAQSPGMYFMDTGYDVAFFDKLANQLFVYNNSTGVIGKWDSGSTFMNATFRSKTFRSPRPINYAAGIVIADTYPVTVTIFADGVQKFQSSIASRGAFRLPSGFTARDWQVEVQTQGQVQLVELATAIQELRQ